MKITPLVMLSTARIPALTDIFSDSLAVSSMTVDAGGLVTINCTSPHGTQIGATRGICVVDALTPNQITDWSELANGDVWIETQFEHELATTPDATMYDAWDSVAIIAGTGVVGLDGNKQLVSVDTTRSFVVRPGGSVTLPPTIPPAASHNDRLERQLTGWHEATATTASRYTFPTPASVVRDYTVVSPRVVTNIRVWGAVDLDHAMSHFSRGDDVDTPVPGQGYLFVCPIPQARLSRDRAATTDGTAEIQPGQIVRQHLMDGFEIYAALPSETSGGAVACMDKAHGPILRAVMRTFNGLRLPFSEFAAANPFVSIMTSHGMAQYTRANYVHQYTFEATVTITEDDCAAPIDIPDISAIDAAIVDGNPVPTDAVQPVGSVPFNGILFGPDPAYGIFQKDQPQPLTALVTIPPA